MNPVSRSTLAQVSVQTSAPARHPEEVAGERTAQQSEAVRLSGPAVADSDEAGALAMQLAALFATSPAAAVAAHGRVDGAVAMGLVE